MTEYYRQRAGARLIISEAVSISPQGTGYPRTPWIDTPERVTAWKRITDAVHQAGGRYRESVPTRAASLAHPAAPYPAPPNPMPTADVELDFIERAAIETRPDRGAVQPPATADAPPPEPEAASLIDLGAWFQESPPWLLSHSSSAPRD